MSVLRSCDACSFSGPQSLHRDPTFLCVSQWSRAGHGELRSWTLSHPLLYGFLLIASNAVFSLHLLLCCVVLCSSPITLWRSSDPAIHRSIGYLRPVYLLGHPRRLSPHGAPPFRHWRGVSSGAPCSSYRLPPALPGSCQLHQLRGPRQSIVLFG